MKYSIKERFRYYFENTFSTGPLGVIRWLAIMSLITILFLGLVIVIFGISAEPDSPDSLSFIEGAWQSLMATLDSGTMGGDMGWAFRMVRFAATLVGIFMISILIGVISAAIDAKIEDIRKGKSKVLEAGHTLILGWSEKIFPILQQIILANENQRKARIVVFAEMDKVEMEDAIREKIQDLKTTKIIIRSGNPMISNEIQIVNPNDARSIIVLSPDSDEADISVIKTVMSLTNSPLRKSDPYHIVAEIKDESNIEAAELVGQGEASFIFTADLIARITAQTCRQSGLAIIYTDLLRFEGDEIYFQDEPALYGKTFREATLSYNTSTIIGIFSEQHGFMLNPPGETIVQKGDEIVAISEDDDTVVMDGTSKNGINPDNVFVRDRSDSHEAERILMLGWNEKGLRIIMELDNYVALGSELVILNESLIPIEEWQTSRLKLSFQAGKMTDRKTLDSIQPETFDHIILMSDRESDVQYSDAQTLICLLHLRSIGNMHKRDMSIVSEMRDMRNREVGIVAKADDFIIGDNIISLIMAQIGENKALKSVFDLLFDSDGSEIYLKPITDYWKEGETVNFYDMVERAFNYNETAIGYRQISKKDSAEDNFGVKLNPAKDKVIDFQKGDYLVVLAED